MSLDDRPARHVQQLRLHRCVDAGVELVIDSLHAMKWPVSRVSFPALAWSTAATVLSLPSDSAANSYALAPISASVASRGDPDGAGEVHVPGLRADIAAAGALPRDTTRLSNIFLHHVLDEWFEGRPSPGCEGRASSCGLPMTVCC